GKLRLTLSGHTGWVWHAAWSPDGARVATASYDQTISVWDVATALAHKTQTVAPLFTVWGHADEVRLVAWSPDGVRLLSAGLDTVARLTITRVDGPGGLIETACAHTGRNFTPEEWLRFMGAETPYREMCPGLPAGSK
ncbi:MAG: hypothetical protein JXA33_27110, partial [Anaerolineae bacterium]|nr:hypothetical protein [Anaerolineae bacterium]